MKTNIAICIATGGLVNWRFASDLMTLQMPGDARVIWQVRTMINSARNLLTKKALEDPTCTHVFMLDDDMTFEPDLLLKLVEKDVDIIGALAFKRTEPFSPCVYKKINGQLHFILPKKFMEVDAIGSAGLLIKREVFDSIPFPFWETYYNKNKNVVGVDIDFCEKAKKKGFKICCEPSAEQGHLGEVPVINKTNFLKYAQHAKLYNNSDNDDSSNGNRSSK